jgi:hypothetical protein
MFSVSAFAASLRRAARLLLRLIWCKSILKQATSYRLDHVRFTPKRTLTLLPDCHVRFVPKADIQSD